MNDENRLKNQHSVDLHIEELVLNGFAPADGYAIGEGLERELQRIIVAEGMPAWLRADGEPSNITIRDYTISSDVQADAVGSQIARTIHGGTKL